MYISVTQVVGGVLVGVLITVLTLGPITTHYWREARRTARQRDRLLERIRAREAYRSVFDELGRLSGTLPRSTQRQGVPPRVER